MTAIPRISAVLTTYNRADLVVRAIESTLSQTRPPDEIVVIDDGSTDDTWDRLVGFGEAIRCFRQANAGLPFARNAGVFAATHPWVAFLDSDDVWTERHLESILQAMIATQERAVFYFGDTWEAGSSLWERAGFSIGTPFELVDDATHWAMLPVQPTMLQSSVVSRSAVTGASAFLTALVLRDDTHAFFRLGIGRSACAVANAGCLMTGDADDRLTVKHTEETSAYWNDTVILYKDILRAHTPSDTRAVAELRERLAAGYWHLGRRKLAARQLLPGAADVARSAVTSPPAFLDRAKRHLPTVRDVARRF